jgi:hypothetical protein
MPKLPVSPDIFHDFPLVFKEVLGGEQNFSLATSILFAKIKCPIAVFQDYAHSVSKSVFRIVQYTGHCHYF